MIKSEEKLKDKTALIYEEDDDGAFSQELDKAIIKELCLPFLKRIVVFMCFVFIICVGIKICFDFSENNYDETLKKPEEISVEQKALNAYSSFLASEVIEWSTLDPVVESERILFGLLDLDNDLVPELLIENQSAICSMSPIQKIILYNDKDNTLDILWESTGNCDFLTGYDKRKQFFVTERFVKGTATTGYWSERGELMGQKQLWEDPLANEFLFEPIEVNLKYEWNGLEVEASIFESHLYNIGFSMRAIQKVTLVENTKLNRDQFLK